MEGKPLHRKDIYKRLTQQGIHVAGQKPVSNVGAHLSLDRRFKSVGEGKWGLALWGIVTDASQLEKEPEGVSLKPDDFVDGEVEPQHNNGAFGRIMGNLERSAKSIGL